MEGLQPAGALPTFALRAHLAERPFPQSGDQVAAVPSIGRATRIERPVAPGADAAGALYERYSAQIHAYCLRQLGSREEAEDAVQTTFMNAFRGLSRGIVPELESAWLFKIAHNVCLSRRRSSWRRGKVEAPNNFEVLQEIVPGREQVADELIRLQDVLEQMPETQRRAILLREWQGLTYREISDELGLSQAAVETLIFRARRALAQGLEQDADNWKKRLRRGTDFGAAIACIKTLLGGGGAAAVKVAATALAVGTTAIAGATDSPPRLMQPPAAPQRAVTVSAPKKVSAAAAATKPHASTARTRAVKRQRRAERRLPRPVAVPPVTAPDETPAAPTETLPAATATPSSPPVDSAPPPAPAATAPAPVATEQTPPAEPGSGTEPGSGKGKDKADRTPQSTNAVTDPPAPIPAVDPLPEPEATPPGHENKPDKDKPDKADKSDKPDHPNNGNGHGNGNK
jgi:RNA polymerase sigma factor (sigma-70 family)